MTAAKGRGQQRGHGQSCGNDAEAQLARELAADFSEFLSQRILARQDFSRPSEDPRALGRQPSETPSVAIDQRDCQFPLELADRFR